MLQIEYKKNVADYKNNIITTLKIDRVVLREKIVIETDDYVYIAGEVLGGHKLVYLKDNKVYLASNDNLECFNKLIGISRNAANENGGLRVAKSNIMYLSGWGLEVDKLYYLGLNGAITSTQPTTGIVQIIGIAKSSNELEIKISLPILKESL